MDEVEAVDYAVELLQEAGAKRLIPLNVSGPFHTALLASASEKLATELEKVYFLRTLACLWLGIQKQRS